MAKDQRTFYVGTQYGPDHANDSRMHYGAKQAYDAAMAQSDPVCIYQFDGRRKHWDLILDRSIVGKEYLPRALHIGLALGYVVLKPVMREVSGKTKARKYLYRWAPGYLVPTLSGAYEYPPCSRLEAIDRAKQIYGQGVRCIVGKGD